jgi:hypothetical protein
MMNTKLSPYTSLLFARPTFLSGFARVLDLGGTFNAYNAANSAEDADTRALHSDWLAVGQDMFRAIEAVTK